MKMKMKKKLSIVLCIALAAILSFMFVGCGDPEPTQGDTFVPPELDLENAYIDNFDTIDHTYWGIMNTRWGGTYHGGVIKDNVGYTADGNLVITANGDFYEGDKKDVTGQVAKRTGGAIVSHQALGPGVFSVRMKALPRFGATTAFWTFFNDGRTLNNSDKVYNSEIDFELNVDTFNTTMCTNWTAVEPGNYDNRKILGDTWHNDGAWHEYTFKWSTSPERVEYYLDGNLISYSEANVPTYAAQANIGVWFASFAGTPDFATDYCLVDWYKYTPYKDQPYTETPSKQPPPTNQGYPTTPTALPSQVNLVGDADFENPIYERLDLNAWFVYPGDIEETRTLKDLKVKGDGIGGSTAMVLKSYDRIIQTFSQVYPGYKIDLTAYVKHTANQSGKIVIQYFMGEEKVIGTEEFLINSSANGYKENEFYKISKTIVVPKEFDGKEVKRVKLRFVADDFVGNQITIDNITMYKIND